MPITMALKKDKNVSLRVTGLAKELLSLEKTQTGESESDIVERCLLQCLRSPDALALIRKYASEDPTLAAILSALESSSAQTGNKSKK